jgi:hypothetical protein
MKMNKDGVFPDDLQSLIEERDRLKNPIPKKQEFANVLDEMNLSRFDNANKSKNNNNKNRKKKKRNGNIKREQK